MTDTPETEPVEGAEILKLLQRIDAQTRATGETLSKLSATVDALAVRVATAVPHSGITAMRSEVAEVHRIITEAEPLLHSAPARALRGGRRVADYLKNGGGRG